MKKSFTLAETLITLTIIGIIAALTVPSLLSSYQNYAYYTGLKKAQSVLNNAYALTLKENGAYDTWGITSDEEMGSVVKLAEKFKDYLNYVNICENQSGCWALTKNLNGNSTIIYGSDRGIGSNMITMKLADGMNLCFDIWINTGVVIRFGSSTNLTYAGIIWVDVNGDKGPNRAGRDVFVFILDDEGLKPAGNVNNLNCDVNDTANTAGFTCTYKVLSEGGVKY